MIRQHSRQSPSHKSQKRIIFLPILERKGESSKKQGSSGTREGQVCSMKVANPTPATRFGVTQQKFSRHRAGSKPPMRNPVTLVVLKHVRTHETTVRCSPPRQAPAETTHQHSPPSCSLLTRGPPGPLRGRFLCVELAWDRPRVWGGPDCWCNSISNNTSAKPKRKRK